MRQEDLFLAIAAVEDDWLLQSEDDAANHLVLMPKTRKQLSRYILVAVLAATILTLTACATVIGFLFYDSPLEMLETFFGTNTKYVQSESYWALNKNGSGQVYLAGFERFPVDEKLAENLEKKIHPVGQSISWHGYTITVDGYLYDSATGCGVISYAIESPEKKSITDFYRVQKNGALNYRDGELVYTDYTHRDYIVREKSDNRKLVVASYFYNEDQSGKLKLHLSYGTYMSSSEFNHYFEEAQKNLPKPITAKARNEILQKWEDMKEISPDSILIDLETEQPLDHIQTGSGEILISPMALTIQREKLGLADTAVNEVIIINTDGTEFVLQSTDTENFFLHYDKKDSTEVFYLFNRLIDIRKIASIRINDLEFTF